ncbi:MAG: tRNA lysidine(34) synthetase TilS [Balneolales bacterium]
MLTTHVESVLKAHNLDGEDQVFILGISGGPDSMVLLNLFYQLKKKMVVAHVNYKKRAVAVSEEKMVRLYCKKPGTQAGSIKCIVKQADSENATGNFQNWARDERRTFFQSLKKKYKAAAIDTAHHKDDQVETLFQKMLRGSSIATWQGIHSFDGTYLRPLLDISKSNILEYAEKLGIPYSIDHTNFESGYARNFIRNEWKPRLDKFFPGWEKNVLKLPERASEYRDMLELTINQVSTGEASLRRSAFLELKLNARKAIILEMIRRNFHGEKVSSAALKNLRLDELQTGQIAQINQNLSVIRDREIFMLNKSSNPPFSLTLDRNKLEEDPKISYGYRFTIQKVSEPDYYNKLYLNVERLVFPITFRTWRAGDKLHPFGFKGTKKISDFLTEKKVNSLNKKEAGVLVSFDESVCAVIFPSSEGKTPPGTISEHVRCDRVNQKCLVIERINNLDE